ncbi:MAG: flotillin-like FloA family protein, partial [marine benthic group bacterium]|nr:flotillin-like FloA family protein [Gemmatimonadota bacterium]
MNETTAVGAILAVFLGFVLIMVITGAVPVRLWIVAFASGVRVGLGSLVGMRLRKVNPAGIIRPLIAATKAGVSL